MPVLRVDHGRAGFRPGFMLRAAQGIVCNDATGGVDTDDGQQAPVGVGAQEGVGIVEHSAHIILPDTRRTSAATPGASSGVSRLIR